MDGRRNSITRNNTSTPSSANTTPKLESTVNSTPIQPTKISSTTPSGIKPSNIKKPIATPNPTDKSKLKNESSTPTFIKRPLSVQYTPTTNDNNSNLTKTQILQLNNKKMLNSTSLNNNVTSNSNIPVQDQIVMNNELLISNFGLGSSNTSNSKPPISNVNSNSTRSTLNSTIKFEDIHINNNKVDHFPEFSIQPLTSSPTLFDDNILESRDFILDDVISLSNNSSSSTTPILNNYNINTINSTTVPTYLNHSISNHITSNNYQRSLSPLPGLGNSILNNSNNSINNGNGGSANGGRRTPNSESIQTVVRFRPISVNEASKNLGEPLNEKSKIIIKDSTTIQYKHKDKDKSDTYTSTKVFLPETKQEQFYHETLDPLVDPLLNGINVSIIAYGQSGSGKTFSLQGYCVNSNNHATFPLSDQYLTSDFTDEQWGLIPRTMREIFHRVNNTPLAEKFKFTIRVSMIEIYVDKLHDLLDSNTELKADNILTDASSTQVNSLIDVFSLFSKIQSIQSNSKISHFGFIVNITREEISNNENNNINILSSSLYIFDLAGSESSESLSNSQMKEVVAANKSIFFLGGVIEDLVNNNKTPNSKSKHARFRECVLTKLLVPALGGNSKTLFIINCSSNQSDLTTKETIRSLDFGKKAQMVRNRPTINFELTHQQLKSHYVSLQHDHSKLESIIREVGGIQGINYDNVSQYILDLDSSLQQSRLKEIALNETISQCEKKVVAYKSAFQNQSQLISESQVENSKMCNTLKQEIQNLKAEKLSLNIKLVESDAKIQHLTGELNIASAENLNWKESGPIYKESLTESHKKEMEIREAKILDLQSQLDDRSENIKGLTKNLEISSNKIKEFEKEINDSLVKISDLELKNKEYQESNKKQIELFNQEKDLIIKDKENLRLLYDQDKEKLKEHMIKDQEKLKSLNDTIYKKDESLKDITERMSTISNSYEDYKMKHSEINTLKLKNTIKELKKNQSTNQLNSTTTTNILNNSNELMKEESNLKIRNLNLETELQSVISTYNQQQSYVKTLENQIKTQEQNKTNDSNSHSNSSNIDQSSSSSTITSTSTTVTTVSKISDSNVKTTRSKQNIFIYSIASIIFIITMFILMLTIDSLSNYCENCSNFNQYNYYRPS